MMTNQLNQEKNVTKQPMKKSNKILLKVLLIMMIVLVCWHFLGALIGISLGLTAAGFGFLMTILVLGAVGLLLAPLLIGIGFIIFFIFIVILSIIGIILFPIFIPLGLVILLILLIVKLVNRK